MCVCVGGGGGNDYGGWEWLYEIRIIHYIGILSIAIFPRWVGGGEKTTLRQLPRYHGQLQYIANPLLRAPLKAELDNIRANAVL